MIFARTTILAVVEDEKCVVNSEFKKRKYI